MYIYIGQLYSGSLAHLALRGLASAFAAASVKMAIAFSLEGAPPRLPSRTKATYKHGVFG